MKMGVSGLYSPMMVGFMGNFLPARAAEILRPYLLSKKYDITFSAAFASIVMERLFDLIMLLLIFVGSSGSRRVLFRLISNFSGILGTRDGDQVWSGLPVGDRSVHCLHLSFVKP